MRLYFIDVFVNTNVCIVFYMFHFRWFWKSPYDRMLVDFHKIWWFMGSLDLSQRWHGYENRVTWVLCKIFLWVICHKTWSWEEKYYIGVLLLSMPIFSLGPKILFSIIPICVCTTNCYFVVPILSLGYISQYYYNLIHVVLAILLDLTSMNYI
jgi:hypothetical protein